MALHAIRIMSQDDYRQLQADGALALDLRRPLDYLEGHLEGSLSLPGVRMVLRHQLPVLAADRPLIVIAQAPVDVDPFLQEADLVGAQIAGILTGTPKGWRARGLPLEGWLPLDAAGWSALDPPPFLVDIREPGEPWDPAWPTATRTSLSGWTADVVADLAARPVCLLGPLTRLVTAGVSLFEAGATTVYRGQGTRSSTVV